MTTNGKGDPPKVPGRDTTARALPKRFYKAVTTERLVTGGVRILLDGRGVRTPRKRELLLPTPALGEAVAGEWAAQAAHIDPARMPLTRLANTALDGVRGREADLRADIAEYAGSDLLCYRAEHPDDLARRQGEQWDPVLAWSRRQLGADFNVVLGVVHVAQPPESLARFAASLGALDAFPLTALHVMTTLTGSALLALAVHARQQSVEAAWAAAHVDEDWQIAQWGEDGEAQARRAARWREMQAAAHLLDLLRTD